VHRIRSKDNFLRGITSIQELMAKDTCRRKMFLKARKYILN
jgi:hypothetical protein